MIPTLAQQIASLSRVDPARVILDDRPCHELVKAYLQTQDGGPCLRADIAAGLGRSKSTVNDAIDRMSRRGDVVERRVRRGNADCCYLALAASAWRLDLIDTTYVPKPGTVIEATLRVVEPVRWIDTTEAWQRVVALRPDTSRHAVWLNLRDLVRRGLVVQRVTPGREADPTAPKEWRLA